MKEYINITIDDEEGTTSAVLKEGSSDEKIYTLPYKPNEYIDDAAIRMIEHINNVSKPHLIIHSNGRYAGKIGEETILHDELGRELSIGDTVKLYSSNCASFLGERPVILTCFDRVGIMGKAELDIKTLNSGKYYKIFLCKKYNDIPYGSIIHDVEYMQAYC
ncbi:MAG: hypothetical protein ACLUVX_12310 [Lachnospira pectinoschiza]